MLTLHVAALWFVATVCTLATAYCVFGFNPVGALFWGSAAWIARESIRRIHTLTGDDA
jgi:hypothetical protein